MSFSNTFKNSAAVTVGTSFTDLIAVTSNGRSIGMNQLAAEIENAGATAFSDFQILIQDHPDGEWFVLLTGTDWATTTATLTRVTTSPKTLAGGARSHVELNLGVANGFKLQAKVASGTTTANVKGRIRF